MFGIKPDLDIRMIDDEELSKITSIKEVKRYEVNPFIFELSLDQVPVYKKDRVFEENDEKYLVAKEIGKRDKAKFIRIFDFNIDLKELKGNSAKILLYILYHKTNYDVSVFYLTNSEITEYVGITNTSSINEAMIELIKLKYIARQTENNWYWINPSRFYRGDRKRIEI